MSGRGGTALPVNAALSCHTAKARFRFRNAAFSFRHQTKLDDPQSLVPPFLGSLVGRLRVKLRVRPAAVWRPAINATDVGAGNRLGPPKKNRDDPDLVDG